MPPVKSQAIKDVVDELTIRANGFVSYNDIVQFTELYKTVQKLIKVQKKKQEEAPISDYDIQNFQKWLADGGVKSSVEIGRFEGMGLGLKAKRDIPEGGVFAEIPRKFIIDEHTVWSSKLEPILSKDPIFQRIPGLAISLFLVHEKISLNSPWAPYIKVLPRSFSLPFYFTLEEINALKGSPLRNQCFQTIVTAARQYCHIHKILHENPQVMSAYAFNYSDFIWAMSCVMSRQNRIPDSPEGAAKKGAAGLTTCLIPYWDFANHKDGYVSTDFDSEAQAAKCMTQEEVKKGEQVFIHYGNRDNREFFAYSGFVIADNRFDTITVSMSPNDVSDPPALVKRKQAVFNLIGVRSEQPVALNGRFLPADFLLSAGILALSDDDVTTIFGSNTDVKKTPEEVLPLVVNQAIPFLIAKVQQWIQAYPEKEEAHPNPTQHTKNASFMWNLEKQILTNTLTLLQSGKSVAELTQPTFPTFAARTPKVVTSTDTTTADPAAPTAGGAKKKKKKSKKGKKDAVPEATATQKE